MKRWRGRMQHIWRRRSWRRSSTMSTVRSGRRTACAACWTSPCCRPAATLRCSPAISGGSLGLSSTQLRLRLCRRQRLQPGGKQNMGRQAAPAVGVGRAIHVPSSEAEPVHRHERVLWQQVGSSSSSCCSSTRSHSPPFLSTQRAFPEPLPPRAARLESFRLPRSLLWSTAWWQRRPCRRRRAEAAAPRAQGSPHMPAGVQRLPSAPLPRPVSLLQHLLAGRNYRH
mmetsp:Transcript_6076/g.16923  ORF Transcript_6076/g.16923 Transcript_6076/m.16923 type:complete len:226 (+) Transcript_6076:2321-2998(+)